MRIPNAVLAVMLAATLAACGTTVQQARGNREEITRDQMIENNFHTAYEAIQALHGNWLNVHANTMISTQSDVVIYQDGVRLGSPTDLKNIDVRTIEYIRHYDPAAATTRYGIGHSQGAILVSSFRQ